MHYTTIFTPTYNRRELIDNLYHSLLAQTDKNFEWLIIDDGSTDDTEKYFSELTSKPQPFPIRYLKQVSGGKHRAINKGVQNANGELFFIVDSDDYLTENAIEKISQWVKTLDGSHKWAGISGLKGFSKQENVGQRNPEKFIDAKNTERDKYQLEGDKAEVYFTNVLRNYPFPEILGENFISEEVVWNAIARDGFYLRWFNEIIYICSYLEGGLTRDNSKDQKNPQGRLLWAKGQLESFPNSLKKRFLAIGIYRHAVEKKESIIESAQKLDVSPIKVALASLVLCFYKMFFERKTDNP